jgi:CRP/FNR family transcriptional regulator, dissimilatory nitrate respiration regulator
MDLKDFIAQVSLFEYLPQIQVRQISAIVKKIEVPKNTIIFTDNQQADRFYIVYKGQVKIYKLSAQGKEHVLHILNPKNILAEVPMFEGEKYPANCIATKNSILLVLFRKDLFELIKNNPQIAFNMLALQAKRLREFVTRIEILTGRDTKQRLVQYFLDKCNSIENNDSFALDMPLTSLAGLLGVTRENLSRVLNSLIKQKIISRDHKQIKLLDREKLGNCIGA